MQPAPVFELKITTGDVDLLHNILDVASGKATAALAGVSTTTQAAEAKAAAILAQTKSSK
jgi:hypothetical protein